MLSKVYTCLLYTSDAADDLLCVDLGGRRIIYKKKTNKNEPHKFNQILNTCQLLQSHNTTLDTQQNWPNNTRTIETDNSFT